MKKKKNNYGCPSCKVINPDMIMIERWDRLQETPYAIEILIRKVEDKDEYYESTNIKLTKKVTTKIFKIEICCDCKNVVDNIPKIVANELKSKLNRINKKKNAINKD